jgi:hypothetical protein
MAKRSAAKAGHKHAKKSKLIPVVSDLESLSRCAARSLCEMARRKESKLSELTLADLRSALQNEFDELREALGELDLLIEEQGSGAKAILLDLEPAETFAVIRSECALCD